MRTRARDASGLTLVELLIGMALSLLLLGVLVTSLLLVIETSVGRSSASTATGAADSDFIPARLNADAGVQRLARSFSADMTNVVRTSDVLLTDAGRACTAPAADPAFSGADRRVGRIAFTDASNIQHYVEYRYTVDGGRDGQLVRYECEGADAAAATADTAAATVLATGVSPTVTPTLAEVAGSTVKTYRLSITNFAGRIYRFDATMRTDGTATLAAAPNSSPEPLPSAVSTASPSPSPSTSPSAAPTAVTALVMLDGDRDGRVDAVRATFGTATPQTDCATAASWTLSDVPSGGTRGTPTLSGSSVTVPITEGAGAADTAVGTFTVAFTPSGSCNVAGFTARPPTDQAAPIVTSAVSTQGANSSGHVVGAMEAGDTFAVTFSETLAASSIPSSVQVTERGGNNNSGADDTIEISGTGGSAGKNITSGELSLGSEEDYLSRNKGAGYAGTVAVDSTSGKTTITITLTGSCIEVVNNSCTTVNAGTGTFSFVPSTTLTDAAATPNAAATSATTVPGANWRMF